MVGSELKAFTISNRFSVSTDPSSRKYVTLYHEKENNEGCHYQMEKSQPISRIIIPCKSMRHLFSIQTSFQQNLYII